MALKSTRESAWRLIEKAIPNDMRKYFSNLAIGDIPGAIQRVLELKAKTSVEEVVEEEKYAVEEAVEEEKYAVEEAVEEVKKNMRLKMRLKMRLNRWWSKTRRMA